MHPVYSLLLWLHTPRLRLGVTTIAEDIIIVGKEHSHLIALLTLELYGTLEHSRSA